MKLIAGFIDLISTALKGQQTDSILARNILRLHPSINDVRSSTGWQDFRQYQTRGALVGQ